MAYVPYLTIFVGKSSSNAVFDHTLKSYKHTGFYIYALNTVKHICYSAFYDHACNFSTTFSFTTYFPAIITIFLILLTLFIHFRKDIFLLPYIFWQRKTVILCVGSPNAGKGLSLLFSPLSSLIYFSYCTICM